MRFLSRPASFFCILLSQGSTRASGLQSLEKKGRKVDLLAFTATTRLMHSEFTVSSYAFVPIVQWTEPRFPKPLIRVRVPVGAPCIHDPEKLAYDYSKNHFLGNRLRMLDAGCCSV